MSELFSGADGQPVEFYHGSCRQIDRFSPLRYGSVGGIYFTADLSDAWNYAEMVCIEEGDEETVMAVHLKLVNPTRMSGIDSHELSVDLIDELKSKGYDGVVGIDASSGQPFEYVVFDPEQVVTQHILRRGLSPSP